MEEHRSCVELVAVHHNDGGLGGTRSSNKKSVVVRWLVSLFTSHNWKISNLLDDVLSSGGISSWDQKLRENNFFWWLPVGSLPHGPLHGCLINIVIEDGFVIDLEFLRSNWRERSTLGVKEFVELLSVFLLEESSE